MVLANAAGPLFGPPGGSALFDDLLPDLLEHLDVPALTLPATDTAALATEELAGRYGPMEVGAVAEDPEVLLADVSFLGEPEPVRFRRQDGSRFTVEGDPPGACRSPSRTAWPTWARSPCPGSDPPDPP